MDNRTLFAAFWAMNGKKATSFTVVMTKWLLVLMAIAATVVYIADPASLRPLLLWGGYFVLGMLAICMYGMFVEYRHFAQRRNLFSTEPFASLLAKHNCSVAYVYPNSKLRLTQECRLGYAGQFPLIINLDEHTSSTILFSFRVTWMHLSNERIAMIDKALKQYHAHLDIGGVGILLKRKHLMDADYIDKLLWDVVALLQKEGFMPETKIDFDKLHL